MQLKHPCYAIFLKESYGYSAAHRYYRHPPPTRKARPGMTFWRAFYHHWYPWPWIWLVMFLLGFFLEHFNG